MVTTMSESAEGGSSQDVSGHQHHSRFHHHRPRGCRFSGSLFGDRFHGHHHHGPRGGRVSSSRFGGPLHGHHHLHHHHMKGSHGIAYRHGHDHFVHGGGHTHHEGPHHRFGRWHVSRGSHGVPILASGYHCRLRRHRFLSPHHLIHDCVGPRGSPHGGHPGRCDGSFVGFSCPNCRDVHHQSQEISSGSESDPSPPLPAAAIERGIEQLGQLSLRSEPGSH